MVAGNDDLISEPENTLVVGSPQFLLKSCEKCWRCKRLAEVIALATYRLKDDDYDTLEGELSTDHEPFLLTSIEELPLEIESAIQALHSKFRLHESQSTRVTSYTNFCDCGANFGDFYLFNEPDGAFFPTTDEDASRIRIHELPICGRFTIRASYGVGIGECIFRCGARAS
jgi:hypothetical protein